MSTPTGSPGRNASGLSKLREAINALEKLLPQFPAGSPAHKEILKSITGLSKHAPASAENASVQQETLRGLQQDQGRNAMMDQVMRSLGGVGAGGGGAGAAPPAPAAAGESPA